jgi:hypothetical protein
MVELCGIKALSFAIGIYLPLSTTLPIFIGGAIRGIVDFRKRKANAIAEEEDLSKGNLFATGLVAGGALAGVIVAYLMAFDGSKTALDNISLEHSLVQALTTDGYFFLGILFFAIMGFALYRVGMKRNSV